MNPAIERQARWNGWTALLAPLAVLSVLCAGTALLFAADASFRHWLRGPGWASFANPHQATIVVVVAAWAGSVVLAAALCIAWWAGRKQGVLPRRRFVAWLAALLASAAAFLPSGAAYLAFAVLLLGPGQHPAYLQTVAATRDSPLLLKAFALRGGRIDDDLLCFAAAQESPAVVRLLVERGAPVNRATCQRKSTALHRAVEGRRYENAEILVRSGARGNVPDESGVTAAGLAARLGDERMLRILSP